MQHGSRTGVDADSQTTGNGVIDREVLALEDAVGGSLPLGNFDEYRFDAVFPALRSHQRKGELRTDNRDVRPQLEQKRDRADVVFVPVGHHERIHLVETVLDVPQIGQDQVDAGFVVIGEQHATVDDEQSAEVLENGHVSADFVDTAERGHPQAFRGQRPGWSEC